MNKVKETLERMIKDLLPVPAALQAQVISVDKAKPVCKVKLINSELELDGVRLRAVNDNSLKGMILTPALRSKVIVGFLNNNIEESYIEKYSAVDELLVDLKSISILSDQIVINNGSLGGLIKIEELVNQINSIVNDINNLKAAFASWTVTAQDGGLGLKLAVFDYQTNNLNLTNKAQLENTKVKHG